METMEEKGENSIGMDSMDMDKLDSLSLENESELQDKGLKIPESVNPQLFGVQMDCVPSSCPKSIEPLKPNNLNLDTSLPVKFPEQSVYHEASELFGESSSYSNDSPLFSQRAANVEGLNDNVSPSLAVSSSLAVSPMTNNEITSTVASSTYSPLFGSNPNLDTSVDQEISLPSKPSFTGGERHERDYSLEYRQSGNAIDIIVIRSEEGLHFSTPWHVMFSWSVFKSSFSAGVGSQVDVYINRHRLPSRMTLLERGRCKFWGGKRTPPQSDFLVVPLHEDQVNEVRFEHRRDNVIRFVECRLHLWAPNESIVVTDLDGTLTKSDVEGHIRTMRLGQYDFIHDGACEFFTKLANLGYRIIYLSARPLDWATGSRIHLERVTQLNCNMPVGPLITNSSGLAGAFYTEVFNKNPHVFKAQALNHVQLAMIEAGRSIKEPVFVCGFGNRPTDVIAYADVGIPPDLIYLINPESHVHVPRYIAHLANSYHDPQIMLWLLPRLKKISATHFHEKIDIMLSCEKVLDKEQQELREAEKIAKEMQLEEERLGRERATVQSNSAHYAGSGVRPASAYLVSRSSSSKSYGEL